MNSETSLRGQRGQEVLITVRKMTTPSAADDQVVKAPEQLLNDL